MESIGGPAEMQIFGDRDRVSELPEFRIDILQYCQL